MDDLYVQMLDQKRMMAILCERKFIQIGDAVVLTPKDSTELPFLVDHLAFAISEAYLLEENLRRDFRKHIEPFLLEILAQSAVVTPDAPDLYLTPIISALPFQRILDELPQGFRYEKLRPGKAIAERFKSISSLESKRKDAFILILSRWLSENFFFSQEQIVELQKFLNRTPWNFDNWIPPDKLIPHFFSKTQLYKLIKAGILEGVELAPAITATDEMRVTVYIAGQALSSIKDVKEIAQSIAARLVEGFGLDSSKWSLLATAVVNSQFVPATGEFQNISPLMKTLEILVIDKMTRLYGNPIKPGALVDTLAQKLQEWGLLEIHTRAMNQDKEIFDKKYIMKVHSDLKLQDGNINLLGLVARLSKFSGVSTNDIMEVASNPRILDVKTGLFHRFEPLVDVLRGSEEHHSKLFEIETDMIRKELTDQDILVVDKVQKVLKKSYQEVSRTINLAKMTPEEKARDLDGTNLGAFGLVPDFLDIFSIWAEAPDRWKDISTTLVTLLQQGRIKDVQDTLNSEILDRKMKSLDRSIRSLILINLAQLAVGQTSSELFGDIDVTSASVQSIFGLIQYDLEKEAIMDWLNLGGGAKGKIYETRDLEEVGNLLSVLIPPVPSGEDRTLKSLDERKEMIRKIEELLHLIGQQRNKQAVTHKGKVQSARLLILGLLGEMTPDSIRAFFFDERSRTRESSLEEYVRSVGEMDQTELAIILDITKKVPELMDIRCFQFPLRKIEKYVPDFHEQLLEIKKLKDSQTKTGKQIKPRQDKAPRT